MQTVTWFHWQHPCYAEENTHLSTPKQILMVGTNTYRKQLLKLATYKVSNTFTNPYKLSYTFTLLEPIHTILLTKPL